MRLAYGAIQRRGTLDHLIERLAGRPAGKLDAPLLAALRLGLYEMLYTNGAPDHAVVADCVELAKRTGGELVTASSTPYCVVPRARAVIRYWGTCATTPPSRRRSSTHTPSGSRACGGRSWGRQRR